MFIPKSKKHAKAYAAVSLSAALLFSTPSLASAASLLKIGSKGSEVREVQSRLKELGYFNYESITGYYGSITQNAVKEFQADKGISQDGIVGNDTRKHLFGGTSTSESSSSSQVSTPLLKKGSRGSAVTQLQQLLKDKGYLKGSVDGIFGNNTYSSVKSFQKDSGLVSDGIVGAKTWAALQSGSTPSRGSSGSSSKEEVNYSGLLKIGSRGSKVSSLQQRLKDLGYLSGKVDGIFGPATEKALKSFQKDNGLVVDGIAGDKTFAKLDNPVNKGSGSSDRGGNQSRPTTPASDNEIEMLAWSEVDGIWPRGTYATVVDFDTGKSFKIMRSGGYNHADCETATAEDTKILKSLYGGAFSWNRRAIIIKVGSRSIAASMAGMPHAGRDDKPNRAMVSNRSGGYGYGQNLDAIKGNDMDGVFDIHFYGSKTHGTNREDPQHQAQVRRAAGK